MRDGAFSVVAHSLWNSLQRDRSVIEFHEIGEDRSVLVSIQKGCLMCEELTLFYKEQ